MKSQTELPIALRPATPADAEALVALMKSVALEERWIRTEWPFDEATRVERFRSSLETARAVCMVAERGGALVGQYTLFPEGRKAELGMFVLQEERGLGLGRRLMEAGERLARERGINDMELEVYAHNAAALALYRSFAFVETDRYPEARRSGDTFETVRMRKTLRSV